jgi:hypothetical protein
MRTDLRRLPLFPVLLLLASASSLRAQEIDSPYRFVDHNQQLNPFAGGITTDRGTLDLGPESDLAFGLRYGIRLAGPFAVEAAATVFPTSRAVQDTTITGTDTTLVPTGAEASMTIGIATADLRFDITGPRTWHRLMPFTLIGVGGAFVLSEDDEIDADVDSRVRYDFGTRLVGELGVGVEWFPLDQLTVRLDARNLLWKIKAPVGLQSLDAPSEEWVQNFLLSAGVAFRF